jgi:hypothetical protein
MPVELDTAATQHIRALKETDFELAYLAVLTRNGLKPLSRWEKPLGERDLDALQQIGLQTRLVRRTVQTGKTVIEAIFSTSPTCLQLYLDRFAGRAVDKSPETVRIEGYLFGYPPCCVEQYARQPYASNDLPEERQKLLFHWACKDCPVTALLLPAYAKVHRIVEGR